LLWSGQIISDLGDWLDFLALIALIWVVRPVHGAAVDAGGAH